MLRNPVVAGMFYPGSASALEAQLEGFIDEQAPREDVLGLISPHAGYMYSGPVAGAVISRVRFTDTFVIAGPNHTGLGQPFSIMTEGTWRTPLGDVSIDSALAARILEKCPHLDSDHIAHLEEHSIEVQLPFLQHFKRDVSIVPITLSRGTGVIYKEIGVAIAAALGELEQEAVIMASSDMTHYDSQESAAAKDSKAIEAILALDEDELLRRVVELHITMCGYGPAVSLIAACKALGAGKAELVLYQTSGDISGDYSSVVGYAGVLIKRE